MSQLLVPSHRKFSIIEDFSANRRRRNEKFLKYECIIHHFGMNSANKRFSIWHVTKELQFNELLNNYVKKN